MRVDQITSYLYCTTLADSDIASNNLLRATIYPDAGGDDDKLSRTKALDWNGTDVSEYTYLGVAGIVKENYPVPSVALDYIGSGNSYSGFDRFDRVVDQKWTGSGGSVDQFTYGYDRNSNRTFRKNVVSASQTTPVYLDEIYGYDGLDRLTAANRGQLVDSDRITDPSLSQGWDLDATGNWQQFTNFDQVNSADTLVQQRTHNEANEITGVGETVGSQWATPAHDRNGNMTSLPNPKALAVNDAIVYDPWNRLIEVQDDSFTTLGAYIYDGLNRRIRKFVPGSPNSYQHFYYIATSQVAETREAETSPVPAAPQYQYVWSQRFIDAPVLRDDRAADPDEVIYYTGDAKFNVTSLVDDSGNPLERYVYTPYGSLTVFDSDWSNSQANSSYDNPYTFTGRRLDGETGLYYFRARYYHDQLGRFISRDPDGYGDGISLYRSYFVPNGVDPSGKWFVCLGLSGGFEVVMGVGIKVPLGIGFSRVGTGPVGMGVGGAVSYSGCLGHTSALGWYCGTCAAMSLSVYPLAAGIWFSLGGGPVVSFNFGNVNKPSEGPGISRGFAGGIDLPDLPLLINTISIEIDVNSGDTTVTFPQFGLSYGWFVAVKVSGTCTACSPRILQKMRACLNTFTLGLKAVLGRLPILAKLSQKTGVKEFSWGFSVGPHEPVFPIDAIAVREVSRDEVINSI